MCNDDVVIACVKIIARAYSSPHAWNVILNGYEEMTRHQSKHNGHQRSSEHPCLSPAEPSTFLLQPLTSLHILLLTASHWSIETRAQAMDLNVVSVWAPAAWQDSTVRGHLLIHHQLCRKITTLCCSLWPPTAQKCRKPKIRRASVTVSAHVVPPCKLPVRVSASF
jgi:hypothetical protein